MERTLAILFAIFIVFLLAWVVDILYVAGWNAQKITLNVMEEPTWVQGALNQVANLYLSLPPWVRVIFTVLVGLLFLILIIVIATSLRSVIDRLRGYWF